MTGKIIKQIAFAAAATALATTMAASRVKAAPCVGDCDGFGGVLINEIVAAVNIFLEIASVDTCRNADQEGDGFVFINEVVGAVNSFLDPDSCPTVIVQTSPTPTVTTGVADTPTPTNTIPPTATRTPSRTATRSATRTLTRTSTPTPTATLGAAVCGDQVVQSGEECDDGGICTGGDNAGTPCTSESQCMGSGICLLGPKIGMACANDAACGTGKCVKCKPFGGDGCAANCTMERTLAYSLKPGALLRRCTTGPKALQHCETTADCPAGPPPTPAPACGNGGCLGGENDSQRCAASSQCPGGRCFPQVIDPTTTGAFVHDGIIQLALPLSGNQALTFGSERNGIITGVIKAGSVSLPRIKVGGLACACVRAIAVKTCGGTLFNEDGSFSTSCTPQFTAGDSACAGKKPCSFVHGEGNSSSGVIGCNGLDGFNLTFTQNAGMMPGESPPPPPTPQPNSGPPVITLSGTGGPGSAVLLNSSAIGTTTNGPNVADKCVDTTQPPHPDFGPDGLFCTDDDPQSTRGTPQTLPQVTGTATGLITNTTSSTQPDFNIGPLSYTGAPYSCANLTGANPTLSGAKVAGAFTALNQPATGDIVVRNIFVPE
jgi:hypothetical protein